LNIQQKTREIVQLVQATPEYTKAKSLKSQILRDPRLTRMVKAFQEEQSRLYNRNLPPQQLESEMKKLVNTFERNSSNTIIGDYASAMQKVQEKVYQINMGILENIDKDLSI